MQQFYLSELPPRLNVAEVQPLHEITEKVEQDKGLQEVCYLLAPRVLKVENIRVQVPYVFGFPPQ